MIKLVWNWYKQLSLPLKFFIVAAVAYLAQVIYSLSEFKTVILIFSLGLSIGLIFSWMISKEYFKKTSKEKDMEKQRESLKNIQELMDELTEKETVSSNKGASTITKDVSQISPIPHCAIVMQNESIDGYVIPYTIDGEDVYQSNSKQGFAFRRALKVLKKKGHRFSVLKPRGSMGNFISKDHHKNQPLEDLAQFDFPVSLMSNN